MKADRIIAQGVKALLGALYECTNPKAQSKKNVVRVGPDTRTAPTTARLPNQTRDYVSGCKLKFTATNPKITPAFCQGARPRFLQTGFQN
jgi:hypothetical protein